MISLLKSKSEFFNRRALYISADKLSVYHWQKGELGSSYLFDTDDNGRKNFKRYLNEAENTPLYILVDVIEEEFRRDTIPHVFGADRQALIKRKQARLFRDANYLYTLNNGREEDGRRDDRLLFMALTNQENIRPWVEMLAECKIPLKGIISVPLLLQSYVKALPDVSDNALFVTMQSISGLRQTFFLNKELQISRLSKLPRFGTTSYAVKIINEVEKIQRYLNSLRLLQNETQLDVYLLADRSTLEELEAEIVSSPDVRRNYLEINKLLEQDDSDKTTSTPFCDRLLVQHLLSTNPRNCYALDNEMRYAKMRSYRYAMNLTSVFLLVSSFIFSCVYFLNGLTYKQESESAKNKTAFYQTRYDLARERLPKTPVEPAQVKVAVEAAQALSEYKATPLEMLSYIGKGLQKYPNIKLDDLDWAFSMNPNLGAVELKNTNPALSISVNGVDSNNSQFRYYQITNINAHIEPFDGNYREAISVVNKFAETLRGFESTYDVSIESFPLDISSSATLEGDVAAVGKKAAFSLRAVIGIN